MLSSLVDPLLHLHGAVAYLVVAGACFGETALFFGFVLPGETAVVLGGVLAYEHRVSLVAVIGVVLAAAILGDVVGYAVGRRFGPTLLAHRPLKGRAGVERTRQLVERRGGPAVLIGRFVPVVRSLVPGIAGLSAMRFQTFLFFDAVGGALWGIGYCFAGYALGSGYERVFRYSTTLSYVLVGVAVIALVAWRVARHRRERRAAPSAEPTAVPAGRSAPPR
jgi:membrane-associated protein